jgi:hypothetical protein
LIKGVLTKDCERKGWNFEPCRECIFNYCAIRTDRGFQGNSVFTISCYLNECPRYLTVLLLVASDFNTDNTSDSTCYFIRSSKHFTFLSYKYHSHRLQHCRFCENISTVHITTPAMGGKSNRNFYCCVLNTEDKLHLAHWMVSTLLNYCDNHKHHLF